MFSISVMLMAAITFGSSAVTIFAMTTTTSSTAIPTTQTTTTTAHTTTTTAAPTSTTSTEATLIPAGDTCDIPSLESKIRFSLKSERNGTGRWISTVVGERSTPAGVSGGESCPWSLRVGNDVTTCPLKNRGVRLVATIEIPPPTTDYKVSLHHSEYRLDLRLVKWELARRFCQQEGGDLVVINSREEAAVLIKMLRDQGQISEDPYENKQVWVGIHDRHSEGNFITVYGEPLSQTGYVQWAIGEPNDLGGWEDCVSLLRYGSYNDEICTKKLAFICERPHYPSLYS